MSVWEWFKWAGFNLLLPVVLPPIAMLVGGRYFASTDEQKVNAKPFRTVQEGQMGWLAVGWAALATYEMWDAFGAQWDAFGEHPDLFSHPGAMSLPYVGWMSFCLLLVTLASLAISVGGAVTAPDDKNDQWKYAGDSIIVTVISGALFVAVHYRVLKLGAA